MPSVAALLPTGSAGGGGGEGGCSVGGATPLGPPLRFQPHSPQPSMQPTPHSTPPTRQLAQTPLLVVACSCCARPAGHVAVYMSFKIKSITIQTTQFIVPIHVDSSVGGVD